MMDKELKKRWVAALRSGEYEQGQGSLRTKDNKFCCLGVLCDIYGGEWREPSGEYVEGNEDYYEFFNGNAYAGSGSIHYELAREMDVDGLAGQLIQLNDDKGADFNEIADYIEENL